MYKKNVQEKCGMWRERERAKSVECGERERESEKCGMWRGRERKVWNVESERAKSVECGEGESERRFYHPISQAVTTVYVHIRLFLPIFAMSLLDHWSRNNLGHIQLPQSPNCN